MAVKPVRLTTSATITLYWDHRRKVWVVRGERVSPGGVRGWVYSAVADNDVPLDSAVLRVLVEALRRELEALLPF